MGVGEVGEGGWGNWVGGGLYSIVYLLRVLLMVCCVVFSEWFFRFGFPYCFL